MMADHDDSLLDKAKRALGMGGDQEARGAGPGGTHEGMHEHSPGAGIGGVRDDEIGMHTRRSGAEADAPAPRSDTSESLSRSNYDTDYTLPDEDATASGPPEMGVGLDRESTSGTGEHDAGAGLDYDVERRGVSDDTSAAATADVEPDAPYARPEPPSGNSPYDPGEDTVETQRRGP